MSDPTTYHPALTDDRLRVLAQVIVRARRDALGFHDPDAGETNLSLGTRTRERACKMFRDLAAEVDWLRYYNEGYYVLLLVGESRLPIKFHRADPDDPPPRTARELEMEAALKQVAFAFYANGQPVSNDATEHSWRLYFQDDPETHEIYSVTLARVRPDGVVDESWPIDLAAPVTTSIPGAEDLPEPAELDRPAVAPLPAVTAKTADGR